MFFMPAYSSVIIIIINKQHHLLPLNKTKFLFYLSMVSSVFIVPLTVPLDWLLRLFSTFYVAVYHCYYWLNLFGWLLWVMFRKMRLVQLRNDRILCLLGFLPVHRHSGQINNENVKIRLGFLLA